MHVLRIIPAASCHRQIHGVAPSRPSKPLSSSREKVALPGPAFPDAALMVGLLVVELVVAGVPAAGGGRDHGPRLPRRVVPWACGARTAQRTQGRCQRRGAGAGTGRHPPHGSCHTCSGAPAFPANATNPSLVLSSGRNPARQRRLGEGVLTRGQGKLVGMEGLTQHPQRQSELNMPRMQLTPHYICFQFEGKGSWSIPHFSIETV